MAIMRKDLMNKRLQINDEVDFTNFIKVAMPAGLMWLDGSAMVSPTTEVFRKKPFPFVLEVNVYGQVVYDNRVNNSIEFKHFCALRQEEKPMTLLVNQKNPGITVTLKDGREFVYDIHDALEDPDYFHDWLKDIVKPPIKVGDIVRLVDCGQLYTTYTSWFKENKVDIDVAARYAYAIEVNPPMNKDYEVVAVGRHVNNGATLYAITQKSEAIYGGNPVYLISERGIRKA